MAWEGGRKWEELFAGGRHSHSDVSIRQMMEGQRDFQAEVQPVQSLREREENGACTGCGKQLGLVGEGVSGERWGQRGEWVPLGGFRKGRNA